MARKETKTDIQDQDNDNNPVDHPAEKIAEAEQQDALMAQIVSKLKSVHDPEIPVDIYELGLIYDVDIGKDGFVTIQMTLTSPTCPVAGILPQEVATKVREVEGVSDSHVELVWEPPWGPHLMSEVAKLELGYFD